MGRKKSRFPDDPPRFLSRPMPSGKTLHYYQVAGKKIPLGADRAAALTEWAKLEAGAAQPRLFPEIAAEYRTACFEHMKVSTRTHYDPALKNLETTFAAFTLEQIEPKHVKKYMRDRSAKGAALFEKRVLSALFNWARGEGYTAVPNPCRDIKFSAAEKKTFARLGKRLRYVTDAEYAAVHAQADGFLQDAMDLALFTGQRPGDLLAIRRQDIVDGVLWFTQEKTGTKLGVAVEDELERVVARILARPRAVPSMYLLCDRQGQRVRWGVLNRRFLSARRRAGADWQFRDIRAKAATDSPDLKRAQELLGHKQETTTTIYRRVKGNVVSPLKRANSEPI